MQKICINEIHQGDALYQKAIELRYLIFFKDHNLPKDIINDEKEDKCTHIVISQGDELIAYGRLFELNDKKFQISQMVVSPQHQKQGYGEKLLLEIIRTAKIRDAKKIILNARTTATRLYEKTGFKQEGQVYNSQSTGVPHIKMVRHENV